MVKSRDTKVGSLEKQIKILTIFFVLSIVFILVLAWVILDNNKDTGISSKNGNLLSSNSEESGEGDIEFIKGTESEIKELGIEVSSADPNVGGVIKQLARHLLLPRGEYDVSTIQDVESLRDQNPFFYEFASNGDKVIIYEGGLIIFSVEKDKVVDIWHPQ